MLQQRWMSLSLVLVLCLCVGLVTQAWSQAGPTSVPSTMQAQNDTTTGTTQFRLAKIVAGKAIIAATTDGAATPPIDLYVCMSGCGTTGNAQLVYAGEAYLEMDAANASGASGWFVVASSTTAGKGHAQASQPTSGMVVGKLWQDSTSTAAGARARIAAGNQPYIPGSPGSGSGTVNPGVANAVACYISAGGTTVDDCAAPAANNLYPKWSGGILTNSTLAGAGIGVCAAGTVMTATNADAVPTCAKVTSAHVDNTVAVTGAGINTSSQPVSAPGTWAFQGKAGTTDITGDLNNATVCQVGGVTQSTCDLRPTGVADRNITGFAAPTTDGTTMNVCNVSTTLNLILKNKSSLSSATNQIRVTSDTDIPYDDLTLGPSRCVALQYSTTAGLWRPFGGEPPDYLKLRPMGVIIGDPDSASPVLTGGAVSTTGNHTPNGMQNHYGRPLEVLSFACQIDGGSAVIQIRPAGTDFNVGTAGTILVTDCTCGVQPLWGTCQVVTGTGSIVNPWSSGKTTARTCGTAPCGLTYELKTVSNTTRYIIIDGQGMLR